MVFGGEDGHTKWLFAAAASGTLLHAAFPDVKALVLELRHIPIIFGVPDFVDRASGGRIMDARCLPLL
jgi:hypothetical protein